MIRDRIRRRRRGYALTVVLVTLLLLFALWSFAARTTSSLLRVETGRVLQQVRDESAMNAMAEALQLLQYGAPPTGGSPYAYQASVSAQDTSGNCTTSTFVVVYTYRSDLGPNRWMVQVTPGTASKPLPAATTNVQW